MRTTAHEDQLQIACVRWFDMQFPEYRMLLHHSPNGGYRTLTEGRLFRKMGTRAGFPDLLLLLQTDEWTALAIELKTDTGKQSVHQKEWQIVATQNGIRYEVVRSFDEFYGLVNEHIKRHILWQEIRRKSTMIGAR